MDDIKVRFKQPGFFKNKIPVFINVILKGDNIFADKQIM